MTTTSQSSEEIEPNELQRLLLLNQYENEARAKGFQLIAGIDEAGRGPLAGPVVAAACIIPQGVFVPQINDSKKLSAKTREVLFDRIIQDQRIIYGIGIVNALEIDRINIYQATIQAMFIAVSQLADTPDCLLVDGMKLPHPTIPCIKIIKGDTLSQSIAAASVLAKVTRDKIMCEYHEKWPQYGFNKHKGYGTAQHLEAISTYGPCDIHRRSFEPCSYQEDIHSIASN